MSEETTLFYTVFWTLDSVAGQDFHWYRTEVSSWTRVFPLDYEKTNGCFVGKPCS